MHSLSWIHARAGGWVAAHAMVWARLPGRGAPLNSFEKLPAQTQVRAEAEITGLRAGARARLRSFPILLSGPPRFEVLD